MPSHLVGEMLSKDRGKVSKASAKYTDDYSGSQTCARCSMFRHGSCTKVAGTISPDGHCRFWEKK